MAKRTDQEGYWDSYGNPGDNTKFLKNALMVRDLPPIDITDVNQVRDRINEYFVICTTNDVRPTVKGFCNALKVAKSTLFEWKRGGFRKNTHQAVILEAYGLLEELWENYMQNGKINPVAGIFLGKNNFDYRDQQEYVVSPNQGQISAATPEAIEAKYRELPTMELPEKATNVVENEGK